MTSSTDKTTQTMPQTTSKTIKKRSKRKAPKTFQEAYQTLKTNAHHLQQQDEPDIDNLMTTVEDSIIAYKVCQERLNAVQKALDETFTNDYLKDDIPLSNGQTTQTTQITGNDA